MRTYAGTADIPAPAMDPDIAYDPAADRGLAVAASGGTIWAQPLAADLTASGPAFTVATGGEEPRAAWDAGAGGWVVAWRTSAQQVRARTVSTAGVLGAVQTVDPGASWIPPGLSLSANPAGAVLVTWSRSGAGHWGERAGVHAALLGDDAAPTAAPLRVTDGSPATNSNEGAFSPDAVWDGARWVLAWSAGFWNPEAHEIRARRFSAALAPLDGAEIVIGTKTMNADQSFVRMAALPARDEVLVQWYGSSPQTFVARALRGSTGEVLDTQGSVSEHVQPHYWFVPYSGAVAALPAQGRFLSAYDFNDSGDPSPPSPSPAGVWARPVAVGPAPQTQLTQAPADGHARPTGSATFTATPAATAFDCALVKVPEANQSIWEPCASPWSFGPMEPLTYYEVRVRAGAGGWKDATPAVKRFLTDEFVAPIVTFDWTPPKMTTSRRGRFVMLVDEPDATLSCSLDGAAEFDCTAGEVQLEDLPLGKHAFAVVATDPQGRKSDALVFTWTVFTIEQEEGSRATPPVAAADAGAPATAKATATSATRAERRRACASRRCVRARRAAARQRLLQRRRAAAILRRARG